MTVATALLLQFLCEIHCPFLTIFVIVLLFHLSTLDLIFTRMFYCFHIIRDFVLRAINIMLKEFAPNNPTQILKEKISQKLRFYLKSGRNLNIKEVQ